MSYMRHHLFIIATLLVQSIRKHIPIHILIHIILTFHKPFKTQNISYGNIMVFAAGRFCSHLCALYIMFLSSVFWQPLVPVSLWSVWIFSTDLNTFVSLKSLRRVFPEIHKLLYMVYLLLQFDPQG